MHRPITIDLTVDLLVAIGLNSDFAE